MIGGPKLAIPVLTLDLERTLISNAADADPRPGLAGFLAFCHEHFERIVLFTTVEESDARPCYMNSFNAVTCLRNSRNGSSTFAGVANTRIWNSYRVRCRRVLLVDDDAGWIRPDQRDRWIAVVPWDGGPDRELLRIQQVLMERINSDNAPN